MSWYSETKEVYHRITHLLLISWNATTTDTVWSFLCLHALKQYVRTSLIPLGQTAESFSYTLCRFSKSIFHFHLAFLGWCDNKSLGGPSEEFAAFTVCVWIFEGLRGYLNPYISRTFATILSTHLLTSKHRPPWAAASSLKTWYISLHTIEHLFFATSLISLLRVCDLTVTTLWRVFCLWHYSPSANLWPIQAWYCEAVIENLSKTLSIGKQLQAQATSTTTFPCHTYIKSLRRDRCCNRAFKSLAQKFSWRQSASSIQTWLYHSWKANLSGVSGFIHS